MITIQAPKQGRSFIPSTGDFQLPADVSPPGKWGQNMALWDAVFQEGFLGSQKLIHLQNKAVSNEEKLGFQQGPFP